MKLVRFFNPIKIYCSKTRWPLLRYLILWHQANPFADEEAEEDDDGEELEEEEDMENEDNLCLKLDGPGNPV